MVTEARIDYEPLVRLALDRMPPEVSQLLERADPGQVAELLTAAGGATGAETIRRLAPDTAVAILAVMAPDAAKDVLVRLDPNRASTLVSRMDDPVRQRCLSTLDESLAQELVALSEYPPDTAGGMMISRVTAFRPDTTVSEVFARLKSLQRARIQDIFLTDEHGKLVGSVPLGEIVLAGKSERLDSIATIPAPSVQAMASRQDVVTALEAHRGASLPVVDLHERLLGVLRQEELVGAARRDAAAKALAMVGVSKDERALSPFTFAVKKRMPWLQINLVTAFLAAAVVGLFESTIARNTALAVLLPVVAGQSGNTGAQALAVTMRGLTLREVRTRHWLQVALKEVLAGATNGVGVAFTTSMAVWFWSSSLGLAGVIALSMVCSMTAAGLAGALIPMILTAVRQDPATSSSIILTTVTDVVGFFSFLGIATVLSSML